MASQQQQQQQVEPSSGSAVVIPRIFAFRHRYAGGAGSALAKQLADPLTPPAVKAEQVGATAGLASGFRFQFTDFTFVSSSYATWFTSMLGRNSTASPAKPSPFHYPDPEPAAPAATAAAAASKPKPDMSKSPIDTIAANTVGNSAPTPASPVLPPSEYVTVIVLGASGDLAKKKTYPALFSLYKHDFLPKTAQIIGYARSHIEIKDFRDRLRGFLKGDAKLIDEFLQRCHYHAGSYDKDDDYKSFETVILDHERANAAPDQSHNRMFYMALPPSVFIPVADHLRRLNYAPHGWTRVIVEKPFGKDLASSRELGRALAAGWHEHELYRIDHYLGKEMVKNLISLRFANVFFHAVWSRHSIANVQITFKEKIGTEGRGGYFDEFGIVRDVMQNHLLQILTLVAMERPVTLDADDVRNEKVKVLRSMAPLKLSDMVLGQYGKSEDGKLPGYLDDKTVPAGSKTPTYAAAVMHINNDRWDGVPFFLRCGKALNEAKTEVRIQFRDVPGAGMFPSPLSRNELVIRVQPNESVYLKLMNKEPGLSFRQHISELDMSYRVRYDGMRIPDAYEALLLDVLRGDQANFVRDDELDAAWSLFTPVLHEIDAGKADPEVYPYGSRGPAALTNWLEKLGVARDRQEYVWSAAPKM
ncbi:Glucose-6-phosphate 1-dehydrogenase [Blastocladiella emersonii ATCC 22665]|nr:Glucose-6-phosphate 1-dehydrogenase [Blastocladiella emersonii ATCC 22665]